MAYLLGNNWTKNYWNQTIIVKDIVEGWVVYTFATTTTHVYWPFFPDYPGDVVPER